MAADFFAVVSAEVVSVVTVVTEVEEAVLFVCTLLASVVSWLSVAASVATAAVAAVVDGSDDVLLFSSDRPATASDFPPGETAQTFRYCVP